ncbi:MAG TPA: hypothetical protein VKC52_15705 [Acidimicrobiia bacterium]|nr:hypothetical protein [Acidimicrobiia bacterium]
MSEHVHVHAPHELTETHGGSTSRAERTMELVAAILLSLATLGIAWSGYQAARWNGRQAQEYAQANASRSLANRADTDGDQERTQDLLVFNQWLQFTSANEQALADAYEQRFRPGFRSSFEAWLAQDPLSNPAAAKSPFQVPEYHVAALEKSDRLERQAAEHFDDARQATERTDKYVLTSVFFASVLFFAGISMRFVWQRMRVVVLVLATVSLVYGVIQVATLPIL